MAWTHSCRFPMFAHALVCSAVSLSLLCHCVMLNSRSTFPPCLSAVTCPSCSVTLFLFFCFLVSHCQINSSTLYTHTSPQHTHTHTHIQFALLSWSWLSGCINIYLPSCPMSPVNTLLSLWNAITTSHSRVPFNTLSHHRTCQCVIITPLCFFHYLLARGFDDSRYGRLWLFACANFLLISPRHSQGLLLH